MSLWEYAQCPYELIGEFYAVSSCPFCRLSLRHIAASEMQPERHTSTTEMNMGVCQNCGWWNAQGEVRERVGHHSTAVYELGSYGVLKRLDLTDVETPLSDVRDYLTAKYETRLTMDPRLFELTVGSVFADHGYAVEVTACSGDGGIDVILTGGDSRIGVQVKRWRGKIEATSIHALQGAMVLQGVTRGIFVTTSAFRSGAVRDAQRFGTLGTPIELLDAPRFLDALRIAQAKVERSDDEWAAKVRPHLRKLGSYTDLDEGSFYAD